MGRLHESSMRLMEWSALIEARVGALANNIDSGLRSDEDLAQSQAVLPSDLKYLQDQGTHMGSRVAYLENKQASLDT